MDYTKCNSAGDFEAKFRALLAKLDVVEGEETWGQIDGALKSVTSLVTAGATKFDTFVPTMKQAAKHINSAVGSERTRLSGTALALVEELARQMETRFSALSDLLVPAAMKTCGRANKVFVTRGVKCLTTVITYAHIPEQTARICEAATADANKTMRASAAKLLMALVSCCTVPELTAHLPAVEAAIASGVVDANVDARTTARQSYEIYIKRFAARVDAFHATLSPTAKKYLKIGAPAPAAGAAAAKPRQPLRDRIGAKRPTPPPAAAAPPPQADAQQPSRPKPVRPLARPTLLAAAKDAGAAAVVMSLAPESGSAAGAEGLQPCAEPGEPGAAAEDAEKPPHDSARPSESPTATAHESRAPSPACEEDGGLAAAALPPANEPAKSGGASAGEPAKSGSISADEPAKRGGATAAPPAKARAQRGAALAFASLGAGAGAGGRRAGAAAPRAVRPASRNSVSARMEAALRGRMTLRSASRQGTSRPPPAGPGYLRATAASAKRCSDAAAPAPPARGTKRRTPHAADDLAPAAHPPPKAAKVGARRRSATK
ncbi:hypothetical protein GGI04_002077 [Coemansia thaxteri]|nr:hypothetical protein GGI04_002077 [Coemansia thaxteri]